MASRMAYVNLLAASGVTISSSAEATGYADDYAATSHRWKKWRSSTTTGDQWIKFDCGANKSFQVMAAITPKLHSGGTLTVQAHTSDAWGAPTVTQVISTPSPGLTNIWVHWLSAAQNLRWFRFYFTNTALASDYAELAVAWAGVYFQPSIEVTVGSTQPARIDPSTRRVAIGGQRSSVTRSKYYRVGGRFMVGTQAERTNYSNFFNAVGSAQPFILALDTSDSELTYYGTLDEALSLSHVVDAFYELPFSFSEDVA
jgi:hypothetical protein